MSMKTVSSFIVVSVIALFCSCGTKTTKVKTSEVPKVYMTTDLSPEGLVKIYEALGRKAKGKVAVKISTGEPGGKNFLQPALIKDLVQRVNGTIVECNTAYAGRRNSTEEHLKAAREHGFFAIANVDIMDAEGDFKLPVQDTTHIKYNLVGNHLKNYDFMINLAHFKGHAMGGFGGVLKNQSIGNASSAGKAYIHTAGYTESVDEMWKYLGKQMAYLNKMNEAPEAVKTMQLNFIESMAAAAQSIHEYFGKGERLLYITVMNNMSVDCDCSAHPAKPLLKDMGIVASLDPVALDQACLDLVFAAETDDTSDNRPLVERIKSRHGTHIVDYAEKIGLGSKKYELVKIDK